jgi:hypothetical protein
MLVFKCFVFNTRKGRKRGPGPEQLSTAPFSTLRAGCQVAFAALSTLEAGRKKLVRNAG